MIKLPLKKLLKNITENYKNIRLVLFTKGENGSLIYNKTENKFYEFSAEKTKTTVAIFVFLWYTDVIPRWTHESAVTLCAKT